jgi:outer membrane protein OmpA-like peptidoglycan-associated protein
MDFGNVTNLGLEINNQLDQSSFVMGDGMVVYTEENIFNSTVKSKLIIGKVNPVIDKDLNYHLSFLVIDSLTKKVLRPNIALINSKINDSLFTIDFNYEGRIYIEMQNLEGKNLLFNLSGYEPKIIKSQKVKTHSIVLMNRMKTYFVLENVYFDFDNYDLNVEAKKYLDIIYTWLLKNQNLKIEIGGHTDDVGGDVYNINLSLKRAYSVYEYLTSKGGVDNLSYKGYGNTKPREDEVKNSKNRRIEFKIL